MTEKRFKKISVCGDWGIKDVQNDKVLFFATTDEVDDTFEVLNELNDECEFLEIENESLEHGATKYAELCHKLSKENTLLKQQIEELKFKLRTIGTIKEDNKVAKRDYTSMGLYDVQR